MIELVRARRGIPNPRGFNTTFGQNQNQFRPQTWGGRPPQNQQRQQTFQRPQYNSTNAPRPAYNNVPVSMDLLRIRAPYNCRQYQNNNTYTNMVNMQDTYGNAVNTPEPNQQRQKGPCFKCGKMGHFARNCCSDPSISINYMDVDDDNMKNIPQPSIAPWANILHIKAQIDALSEKDNDTLIEAMGLSQDFIPA
jgi:Zinc knuckle